MSTSADGQTPVEQVVETASGWPEVTLGPHSYDGVELHLGDYEFGHLHHGWESLHVNYPRRMRDGLIEEGRTAEHPYFPNSGWTKHQVRTTADVGDALELLRLSYLYRAVTRREKPDGRAVLRAVDVTTELDELDAGESVREVFDDVLELRA